MRLGVILVLASACMEAQNPRPYLITTFAGKGRAAWPAGGVTAAAAQFFRPERVALDASGNLYVSDSYYNQVFRISASGAVSVVAGKGEPGYSGDGGDGAAAQLRHPLGLALDRAGNLYIADSGNDRVRMVAAQTGLISTIAGTGAHSYLGDGREATGAALAAPSDVALDARGNLYIADAANNAVRRVDASGTITTVAGTGEVGYGGDRAAATTARLNYPTAVALDATGNLLYISDRENLRVRVVAVQTGLISTIAGNGVLGYFGDGGRATAAQLFEPEGLAVDARGNLYIADSCNSRVRMVAAPTGLISTAVGGGGYGSAGDGGPATAAQLGQAHGLALDAADNLYIADYDMRVIRRRSAYVDLLRPGTMSTFAGVGAPRDTGDRGPASAALLLRPSAVATDSRGALWIADQDDNRVRKVAADGTITTMAGVGAYGFPGDGGPALSAHLSAPQGLFVDPGGNAYLAMAYRVRRVDAGSGLLSIVAGTGTAGYSGDGGPAARAELGTETRVALDSQRNVYISDFWNHCVRKVSPSGIITTIAGNGTPGYNGDNQKALTALLAYPMGMAVDTSDNLYVADQGNHRVRRIAPDGTISTVAGKGRNQSTGDGGLATDAQVSMPSAVAFDAAGNLYLTEWGTGKIRRVSTTGIITTIAGTGQPGFGGDGGPAIDAMLDSPQSLTVDAAGNIYIADTNNMRVRRLEPVQLFAAGVLNSASFQGGAVAPGELVTIYGADIGPLDLATMTIDGAGRVSRQLGGVRVLFDDREASMIYAMRQQVSVIVPYAVAGQASTRVRVEYQGQPTNTVTVPVTATAPALFTATSNGRGQAAALNQDWTVNNSGNPAAVGSVVMLYGTGEGQTVPAGVDGQMATGATLPRPAGAVTATVGGLPAEVLYGGAAPQMVAGVLQVNVKIPEGVAPGAALVVVSIAGKPCQSSVTVAVK